MNSKSKNTIRQWAEEDRPREKLIKKGVRSLSVVELLAILIKTGTANQTAIDLARQLYKEAENNLNNLATFDLHKYKKVKGLGNTKAVTIIAALELGKKLIVEEKLNSPNLNSSREAFIFFRSLFADNLKEEAWFVTLNNANKPKGHHCLSSGGKTSTVIDVRLILKQALYDDATSIILAHNHPSGNIRPSQQDIEITKKLKEASRLLDITLLDHLIISQNEYYSFADEGIL